MHRCSNSCKRFITKNSKCFTTCRYGFPRASYNKACLNTLEATVKSRKRGKNPIKLYNLKREHNEQFINDYNPLCLMLWEGNMDIQYIPEKSMILNRYISSYVTKTEKNATQKLWEDCNKNKTLHGALKSFALQSFKTREMGAYEVTHKLIGYPLHGKSCAIKWLGIALKDNRKRRLKEKHEIELMDAESTEIFHYNLIDTYYPNRPESLKDKCLFEIASDYDFKKEKCKTSLFHENCVALNNNFGYLHKRSDFYLIKTPRYNPARESSRENFFHMLLILFKPWREETELISGFDTYAQAFHEFSEKNSKNELLLKFQSRQKKSAEIIDNSFNINKKIDEEIQKEDDEEIQKENDELNPLNLNDNLKSFDFEFPTYQKNETLLQEKIQKLNKHQKEVFD
jgi:hypothetical protein